MKTYIRIIGIIVFTYAGLWTFNHISPIVSIIYFLPAIGFIIIFLTKQFNKKDK